MFASVSTSRVGPCAITRPSLRRTIRAHSTRRQFKVLRGHHHRRAPLAVESFEERGDLELVAEVERRCRLVEQQEVSLTRSQQRRRAVSPPLSVANARSTSASVPVAARASRAMANRPRPRARTRRGAGSGPWDDVEHGEVKRRMGFLRDDGQAAGEATAREAAHRLAVENHRAVPRLQHAGHDAQQCCLARSVR